MDQWDVYSGYPRRNIAASPSIKSELMTQFCSSKSISTRLSAKAVGRSLGFRIPSSVKAGRAWASSEVPKRKACGCICLARHAPLSTKSRESRRKRPHFAHLTETECQTGREIGIHVRTKPLIADHRLRAMVSDVGSSWRVAL